MLVERLAVYPSYVQRDGAWIDRALRARVLEVMDAEGLPAPKLDAGRRRALPAIPGVGARAGLFHPILERAMPGTGTAENEIAELFAARGESFHEVCTAADALRRDVGSE